MKKTGYFENEERYKTEKALLKEVLLVWLANIALNGMQQIVPAGLIMISPNLGSCLE